MVERKKSKETLRNFMLLRKKKVAKASTTDVQFFRKREKSTLNGLHKIEMILSFLSYRTMGK